MKLVTLMRHSGYVLLPLIMGIAASAQTEDSPNTPPWISPDIVKAAIEIRLDDNQQEVFRTAVGDFIDSYFRMIRKESRRNAVDQPRRIARRTRSLVGGMDKAMKKTLLQEQWPAYERYRTLLVSALQNPGTSCCDVPLLPDAPTTHH